MEFIKKGKNYLIKNSNGRVVDEKTKLELENKELVLKDIKSCGCQAETTKKISKNKKRIKELEDKKIKALMLLTNTKQIDMADKLGTTQANISRIIAKGNAIRIDELYNLVDAAGGTVEISIVLPDGNKL